MKHPMQPIERDEYGVLRFRPNGIVKYLLQNGSVDDLALQDFPQEDREQFAQLLGCSIVAFGEMSCVSRETYMAARKAIEQGVSSGPHQ